MTKHFRHLTLELSRLTPGQTRFGIYQNLDCAIDRQCLRVWYCSVHCAPFYFSISGDVR
jgi:hypothetical protein